MRPGRWWSVMPRGGSAYGSEPVKCPGRTSSSICPTAKSSGFHPTPAPRQRLRLEQSATSVAAAPRQCLRLQWSKPPVAATPRQWLRLERSAPSVAAAPAMLGWNDQQHQWQQPQGNAYGRNDHQRQWQEHGNGYGWNGQNRQWQQPANNAYGSNDHQRQWQQPSPSAAQGNRPGNQQFQPANWGQQSNTGSSYNRAGYPAQAESPNTTPRWSGYNHNTTIPASQSGTQPVSNPTPAGNTPPSTGQTPSGSI